MLAADARHAPEPNFESAKGRLLAALSRLPIGKVVGSGGLALQ